jgi:hypothetical protein
MVKPFDYVSAINSHKDIMTGTDNDKLAEHDYNPWIVNKHFSYFHDTIYMANEMNSHYHIDNKLQFSFYINIIRKGNRFQKWVKSIDDENLKLVCSYYNYSYEKGREALKILSEEDIKIIKTKLEKGGLK